MRIRSTAIAPTSSGGPISARVTRWVTRAAGPSGVSAALVVSIGGKSPPRPATGTNRVTAALYAVADVIDADVPPRASRRCFAPIKP